MSKKSLKEKRIPADDAEREEGSTAPRVDDPTTVDQRDPYSIEHICDRRGWPLPGATCNALRIQGMVDWLEMHARRSQGLRQDRDVIADLASWLRAGAGLPRADNAG